MRNNHTLRRTCTRTCISYIQVNRPPQALTLHNNIQAPIHTRVVLDARISPSTVAQNRKLPTVDLDNRLQFLLHAWLSTTLLL